MIYHLLKKPVKLLPNQRVQWECSCGLNVALPAAKLDPGTSISVPDEKTGQNIVECAACYSGVDEQGEAPVPVGAASNERELDPTFDADLGDEEDDQEVPGTEPEDSEAISTESEEFPE